MPDSVMLNSYFMLYLIPLCLYPLDLIPGCPLKCYDQFLFSVMPDSVIPIYVMTDSCIEKALLCLIPIYLILLYLIPLLHVKTQFRYAGFPWPLCSPWRVLKALGRHLFQSPSKKWRDFGPKVREFRTCPLSPWVLG